MTLDDPATADAPVRADHPVTADTAAPPAEQRPLIESLGLAVIALVVTTMFAALAVAALGGGEVFLGVMAGIGAAMTVWAAASTLRRR